MARNRTIASAPIDSPQGERDLAIDLLRGVAILGIVIFHLWGFTQDGFSIPARQTWFGDLGTHVRHVELWPALCSAFEVLFHSGRDGVSLFIMLSGTALAMGAVRRVDLDPLAFYRRRFPRLLRAYWAGFAIVLLSLFLLAIPKTMLDGGSFRHNWSHVGRITYFDMDQLLAGLTLLPRVWKFHWFIAPPNPLWFVALILQFYLVFPLLFRLAQRYGIRSVLIGSLVMSVASTAGLLYRYDGQLGVHGWIITIWLPFRMFDFVLGMALGYMLMQHRDEARRLVSGPAPTLLCIAAGITVYLLGAMIDDEDGYYRAIAFPLIAAGLGTLALPLLLKAPGRLELSVPARTLAWIGPMSLAVLIMNEPFRYVDHYLWLKGLTWSPGWWVYIVVLYVPGTLIGGALLARALRLTPAGHPTQLLRGLSEPKPQPVPMRADAATYRAPAALSVRDNPPSAKR